MRNPARPESVLRSVSRDPEAVAHERSLAAAFRAGDPEAFAQLVRMHQRRLFVIAVRRVGSAEVAEDAVQVALSNAHKHLAALPEDADVGAWLARVVENAAIDQARRETRHHRLAERAFTAAPERNDRTGGARTIARELSGMECRELGKVLGEGIAALPDPYRRPLELFHLKGLPVEEVAAVLGLNVNTVKSHLARGRGALRRRLTPRLRRGGFL